LLEAGIVTDNPNSVSAAVGMIEKLVETSTQIDSPFLSRIRKITVHRDYGGNKSKARATAKDHRDPVTWLLGIHTIDDPKDKDELRRIEAGMEKAEALVSRPKSSVSWIRYGGTKSRLSEARRGDNVIVIHREQSQGVPERVYRHAPILLVQQEPNCTRLYYEDFPNSEKTALSWSQFRKLVKLVGLPTEISKDTTRRVTDKISDDLNHYWENVRGK
jgi:hypothetical protein